MSGLSLNQRLAQAIGYPTPAGDGRFAADGMVVCLVQNAGIPRLEYTLCLLPEIPQDAEEGQVLAKLSGYALGAAGKSPELFLAYDPDQERLFLWRPLPGEDSTPSQLRECFEHFVDLCEWWRNRYLELTTPQPTFPGIIFRP